MTNFRFRASQIIVFCYLLGLSWYTTVKDLNRERERERKKDRTHYKTTICVYLSPPCACTTFNICIMCLYLVCSMSLPYVVHLMKFANVLYVFFRTGVFQYTNMLVKILFILFILYMLWRKTRPSMCVQYAVHTPEGSVCLLFYLPYIVTLW